MGKYIVMTLTAFCGLGLGVHLLLGQIPPSATPGAPPALNPVELPIAPSSDAIPIAPPAYRVQVVPAAEAPTGLPTLAIEASIPEAPVPGFPPLAATLEPQIAPGAAPAPAGAFNPNSASDWSVGPKPAPLANPWKSTTVYTKAGPSANNARHYDHYVQFTQPTLSPELAKMGQELSALENQTLRLSGQLRDARRQSADQAKIAELKKSLDETVRSAFAKRKEIQGYELRQLRQRLEKVEKQFQRREELREQIIERRIGQLSGEAVDEWEGNDVQRYYGNSLPPRTEPSYSFPPNDRAPAFPYGSVPQTAPAPTIERVPNDPGAGSPSLPSPIEPLAPPTVTPREVPPLAPQYTPATPSGTLPIIERSLPPGVAQPVEPKTGVVVAAEKRESRFHRTPADYLTQVQNCKDRAAELDFAITNNTDASRAQLLQNQRETVQNVMEVLRLEYAAQVQHLQQEIREQQTLAQHAETNFGRMKKAHDARAISATEFDEAAAQLKVAQARVDRLASLVQLFENAEEKVFGGN